MTFDEWYELEKAWLERFKRFWLNGNKGTPEQFPLDMPVGEWDEQYRIWESLNK